MKYKHVKCILRNTKHRLELVKTSSRELCLAGNIKCLCKGLDVRNGRRGVINLIAECSVELIMNSKRGSSAEAVFSSHMISIS